jgi:hypothetical protein
VVSSENADPRDAEKAEAAEDRVARARLRRTGAADEDDIAPKLPRGAGFKISKSHLFKITLTAALLVMLIAIQRPCADAVSKFVTSFDETSETDKAQMPKPGNVDGSGSGGQYEMIRGDMTEAEMKAAVERARAKAGIGPATAPGSSAAGSAASDGAGATGSSGVGSASTGSASGSGAP